MRPPFTLTAKVLNLVSEISRLLGRYEGLRAPIPQPKLRRQNRIRSIQGSLAIEGNTLNLDQITAIFENQRVVGPKKDVLEVQNAIRLYEVIREFKPASEPDLLRAHRILMSGIAADAGKFRSSGVGIIKGSKVSHVAPPAKQVPRLVSELLDFLKMEKDLSPLVKACVFHYELEFIHPFSDGNGRMGRFWQSVILTWFHPAFEFIPIESVIKSRQAAYYKTLEKSDKAGNSTAFVEFSLDTIRDALADFLAEIKPGAETPEARLATARDAFSSREFTRREYLLCLKTISTATASRDLALGVKTGMLRKSGTQATACYRFV